MLRRMAEQPQLAHLVPFMHALLHAPTDLFVSVAQRLFQHAAPARGDSSEGTQQGFAFSSGAFCVTIQPELEALDAELAPFGGAARAITDDAYAIGPPEAVFPALERFATALRTATGLEVQQAKYACWSPTYDLERCPWRQRVGAGVGCETVDDRTSARYGERVMGVMIGGVPVGEPAYVQEVMRRKADEIVSYIDHTVSSLRDHPHSAWAALQYCCASRRSRPSRWTSGSACPRPLVGEAHAGLLFCGTLFCGQGTPLLRR